jgi:hypothetical protein
MARLPVTNEERFEALVVKTNDCWIWIGARNKRGYGQFKQYLGPGKYKSIPAHCFSYELRVGPIPPGKVLDHIVCDLPPCVNPWHTTPATIGENVLRGIGITAQLKRQTHCKNGHALTGENLRIKVTGARICRICQRGGDRRRDHAQRMTLNNPQEN